jgi:diguanylate cyclase (GGDEF)-like protein
MIVMENVKPHRIIFIVLVVFLIAVMGLAVGMSLRNSAELRAILEESVKSQLISVSIAARAIIDVDKFESYNSSEDVEADMDAYIRTRTALRVLQKEVGAKYIYAIKRVDGEYRFIFDTDIENETMFDVYELSPVHVQAFHGREAAGIMNVADEWGSYNTGAAPIWKDGVVIGVICTDTEDTFIRQNISTSSFNAFLLVLTMIMAICAMLVTVMILLHRVQAMQEKLFLMANYDSITGLPNRQYLMDYLDELSSGGGKSVTPYALMFVDLDNFKKVNDGAGHDAGDELLRNIAVYLDSVHSDSKLFRPSAGTLNVSARVGGDEFVKIAPGILSEEEAAELAQTLLDNFGSQSTDRFIEKYQVGLSIGIALFPYHTSNYNVLIKYADIAMYHAKRSGKNGFCIYSDELGTENIGDGIQEEDTDGNRKE